MVGVVIIDDIQLNITGIWLFTQNDIGTQLTGSGSNDNWWFVATLQSSRILHRFSLKPLPIKLTGSLAGSLWFDASSTEMPYCIQIVTYLYMSAQGI